MFLIVDNAKIANYADDTTPYLIGDDINVLLNTLEIETKIILNWFQLNEMKSDNDKGHLMVTTQEQVSVKLGEKNYF